jgi:hypothetical protein
MNVRETLQNVNESKKPIEQWILITLGTFYYKTEAFKNKHNYMRHIKLIIFIITYTMLFVFNKLYIGGRDT